MGEEIPIAVPLKEKKRSPGLRQSELWSSGTGTTPDLCRAGVSVAPAYSVRANHYNFQVPELMHDKLDPKPEARDRVLHKVKLQMGIHNWKYPNYQLRVQSRSVDTLRLGNKSYSLKSIGKLTRMCANRKNTGDNA